MRAAAIFSEAARNLISGTSRAVTFSLLLSAILAGLVIADALAVHGLETRAETFRASGASTRVLQLEGSISGTACDHLTGSGSIEASGAIVATAAVQFSALPSTTVPAFNVTPGLIALLADAPIRREGAWVSETLATTLAVDTGDTLATSDGPLAIAGTYRYPDDGRDSRLGYAVLLPVPTGSGSFDECWASAWPLSGDTDVLLRSSAFATGSTDPLQIAQLNRTQGSSFDAQREFETRITRFASPLAAGVSFGLGWVSIRLRRLEHAAALHAGQSRSALMLGITLETAAWALLGAVLAGAISLGAFGVLATASSASDLSQLTTLIPIVAPALPAAGGAALIGAALAGIATREKHLFRYFKERT